MRPLPYRMFLWVFGLSNAVVWFCILYAVGAFVQSRLAEDGRVSRGTAVRLFGLGVILPLVLSVQGAIVNLRAQFLTGRFLPPAGPDTAPAGLRNPWSVAVLAGVEAAAIYGSVLLCGSRLLLPDTLRAGQVGMVLAASGALTALLLIVIIGDREFRRYLRSLDEPLGDQVPVAVYVARNVALPWGAVNMVINAGLAWLTYHQGVMHPAGNVAWDELRVDVVVMAFMISIFMALSALPEAETDFRRSLVRVPQGLPLMPRLWTRYAYALGLALLMHSAMTGVAMLSHTAGISLAAAVVIKGLSAGGIAGGAAGLCALWALSRCAQRNPQAMHAAQPVLRQIP